MWVCSLEINTTQSHIGPYRTSVWTPKTIIGLVVRYPISQCDCRMPIWEEWHCTSSSSGIGQANLFAQREIADDERHAKFVVSSHLGISVGMQYTFPAMALYK